MTGQSPAELLEFARNYSCGHCDGDTVELTKSEGNAWSARFRHNDDCPIIAGAISSIPDKVRALPEGSQYREES
ncbi:hypothetical protein [Streptomyces xanthochromogenes]